MTGSGFNGLMLDSEFDVTKTSVETSFSEVKGVHSLLLLISSIPTYSYLTTSRL